MGGAKKSAIRRAAPTVLWSSTLLLIWFGSSVCSTLVNKDLMDHFPYAVTLSAVHMASSALVDLFFVYYRGMPNAFRRDVLWACLPVALTINFGKTMTYVSYGMVPASLTHTAKASSPVFSVLVSKVLFNQVPSRATALSLIPITVGVTLSALTELNWVFLGFLAAVGAALANVLNSTYTKKALHSTSMSVDPLIFHMYTAAAAVTMLLPWAVLVEMPRFSMFAAASGSNEQSTEALAASVGLAPSVPSSPAHHVFPWRSMLLSLALHYAQNLSNIYYLHGVSVLTHQVAQSLKRLLNIAGAVLYFGNAVTIMNVTGMTLALVGFSMYSYAKSNASANAAAAAAAAAASGGGATSPANGRKVSGALMSPLVGTPLGTPLSYTPHGHGGASGSSTGTPFVASPTSMRVDGVNGSGGSSSIDIGLPTLHPSASQANLDATQIEMQPWTSAGGGGEGMGSMARSESQESFHTSASPDSVYTQYALHPTAHAHAIAAQQAQQALQQQQAQHGYISPNHNSARNLPERQALAHEDENFLV